MFALDKMIAPSKPRDARLNGLQESGLLEYFLEPKLSNFLTGAQRARMEEFEAMGDEIEIDPATAKKGRTKLMETNRQSLLLSPRRRRRQYLASTVQRQT